MRHIVLIALAGSISVTGPAQAQPPSATATTETAVAIDATTRSRLPLPLRDDLSGEARALYDRLREAGETGGAIAAALHSPAVAVVLDRMRSYLRNESLPGARVYALASLVTAREMSLAFTWSEHESMALQAGVAPSVIDVVRNNAPLEMLNSDDALVVGFGRQLLRNRYVESQHFAALLDRFGRQGAFDIMMTLTWHQLTGMLLRAVDQQPPPGWIDARMPAMPGLGTPAGEIGRFVDVGPRPPIPQDVYEGGWYRLPLLRRDELDARGREIFDRLVGADVEVAPRGPVGMTFNSPELAEPVQDLNTLLRVEGALSRRTAEIVITATGREMNSQYQWVVHGAAAADAGAGDAVLEAIRDDGSLAELDAADALAIAMSRELFRERTLRPETFAAAVETFGTRGMIEIVTLVGDYLMMTNVYNALGMRLRPDQNATLPHRVGAPVGAEWR